MHTALEGESHPLGVPAVGRDRPVGVENERVHHVGLLGDPHHVLLERGEVVEQDRGVRDRRQAARKHFAAPLDLDNDRRALAVLDHHENARHHQGDHEERAQEQLGSQRARSHRGCSSQIFRNGM